MQLYTWHYRTCNIWLKTVAFMFVYLENIRFIDWLIESQPIFLANTPNPVQV